MSARMSNAAKATGEADRASPTAASTATRRRFLQGTAAATVWSAAGRPRTRLAEAAEAESGGGRQLFWGDLHNHNAVGYAQGSLQRSIDLAREHLDFFAFTGHASWHDMPIMPEDRHLKWVRGFDVHRRHWPQTRRMLREANDEHFVALLGYEWHSSKFGDYCVIFPEDDAEGPGDSKLFLPDDVESLLDFAENQQALAIPHHVGYKQGWRGANFAHFRSSVSPVVEVFSEHGCTESDQAPFPMIRHSMGGRSTANTIQTQLADGLRFGFVASSDDHRGYPGAYGEGVVGVWADELTNRALFDAIRARRTYAATGDRIVLEMTLNGRPMGAELPAQRVREIEARIEGQDSLAMIELVKNGRVIERAFPEDSVSGPVPLPGVCKLRIRYGWGPWAALNLGRTCEWDFSVHLEGGRLRQVLPCFQSAPFEEAMRDRLLPQSSREFRVQSATTRVQCYSEDPTKAVVCEVDAEREDAELVMRVHRPVEKVVRVPLADLRHDNVVEFTGGFTSESFIIDRLVAPQEYNAQVRWRDVAENTRASRSRSAAAPADWYYVRVSQHNGQRAWSSPVWVG